MIVGFTLGAGFGNQPQMPVRIEVTATPGSNPVSTALAIRVNLTGLGGLADARLSEAGGGACDALADGSVFTACLFVPLGTPAGLLTLPGTVSDAQGRSNAFSMTRTLLPVGDLDSDGLTDGCEYTFNMNPINATAFGGGAGDPDGDGRERERSTHAPVRLQRRV